MDNITLIANIGLPLLVIAWLGVELFKAAWPARVLRFHMVFGVAVAAVAVGITSYARVTASAGFLAYYVAVIAVVLLLQNQIDMIKLLLWYGSNEQEK